MYGFLPKKILSSWNRVPVSNFTNKHIELRCSVSPNVKNKVSN